MTKVDFWIWGHPNVHFSGRNIHKITHKSQPVSQEQKNNQEIFFSKHLIIFCQMSRNDKIQNIFWSDNLYWGIDYWFIHHQDRSYQSGCQVHRVLFAGFTENLSLLNRAGSGIEKISGSGRVSGTRWALIVGIIFPLSLISSFGNHFEKKLIWSDKGYDGQIISVPKRKM